MKIWLPSTTAKRRAGLVGVWLMGLALLCCQLPVCAENTQERILAQQEMTVESNEIPGWPTGPVVTAESAILIEAQTGAILYAKNIHARQYPASTTKILTTLIAMEQCSLDEWVTFSRDAVYDTPSDSNHIAMDVGQQLTMEDCLNAILIRSANEVAFAVAEHITGTSWRDFAEIMNRRAQELGCVDSHFANPNGLPDENHYTSAYDLAMIGKAFFSNEVLCRISLTPRLHILPNDHMPYEKLENSKNELLPGKTYGYDDLVGAKTGYTNAARSCLVSCAERDGLKLICVVLRDEAPAHYEDTIALFNYGFSNFVRVNVSQAETKYNIANTGFFYEEHDIFGSSKPLLSLNQEAYIVLPRSVDFADTVSAISYDTADEGQAAIIEYSYQGVALGSVSVDLAVSSEKGYSFESGMLGEKNEDDEGAKAPLIIFVNVKKVLMWMGIAAAAALALWGLWKFLKDFQFPVRRTNTRRSWEKDRRKHHHTEYEENPEREADQQRRQQVKEARRRQSRMEYDESPEPSFDQLRRQQMKEARRRKVRMEQEEPPELTFKQMRRQQAKENRRRKFRMEYEESPELTFGQVRSQQVKESRRRRRRNR
ncbi:MAG: D-alanyl-D-alanine carboxypeptidase [Acetatifactor sp.]|nr:D-alanyl-D-alanine carboxypeptidase [Acetatifactor sp.]